MNLPSERDLVPTEGQVATLGTETAAQEVSVVPFEFRSLNYGDPASPDAKHSKKSLLSRAVASGTSKVAGSAAEFSIPTFSKQLTNHDTSDPEVIEAARREGYRAGEQEGRKAARAELEAEMRRNLAGERSRVAEALLEFRNVRERYFAEVEQEVVKLSLAIAGRVLHRETQIDPLLLTGVVRVALEKMADRSSVVVRVTPTDVGAWQQVFASMDESARPQVIEDVTLQRGDCVLESKMGTVELGVQVQLEEIEKGFFDLLNHRPEE